MAKHKGWSYWFDEPVHPQVAVIGWGLLSVSFITEGTVSAVFGALWLVLLVTRLVRATVQRG